MREGITVPSVLISSTERKAAMSMSKKPRSGVAQDGACASGWGARSASLKRRRVGMAAGLLPPAPFTRKRQGPHSASTRSATAWIAASSVTSHGAMSGFSRKSARPGADAPGAKLASVSATFSSFSRVRPTSTTLQPSEARCLAMAEHSVPPAPVTTAT